mgnify:CR=1 FL=1
MAFSSVFMGYYILNIYKMFGAAFPNLSDDSYLTTVGVLASMTGTLRFCWSALLDFKWASFKRVYGVLLVSQIALGSTLLWAANNGRITFAVWVSLIIFCEGGHFTLMPHIFKKTFGEQMAIKAYGVGFSFTGLASMMILVVVTTTTGKSNDIIGSCTPTIYLSVTLSAMALLVLVFFFNEEPYLIKDNFDKMSKFELEATIS